MSADTREMLETLMANPEFDKALQARLTYAQKAFRQQRRPEEEMQSYLTATTVAFVKLFLKTTIDDKMDKKEPPIPVKQSKDHKALSTKKGSK